MTDNLDTKVAELKVDTHAIENAYLFNKVHPEAAFQELPHDHPAMRGDKTETQGVTSTEHIQNIVGESDG